MTTGAHHAEHEWPETPHGDIVEYREAASGETAPAPSDAAVDVRVGNIVETVTAGPSSFGAAQAVVTEIPSRIVAGSVARTHLRINNAGANPVYLGDSVQLSPTTGFPLAPGSFVEIHAGVADVFACSDLTLTSTVGVLQHFL
jgi:hypothetical protein